MNEWMDCCRSGMKRHESEEKSMKEANLDAADYLFFHFSDESCFNPVEFHLCIISTLFILQFGPKIACSKCSNASSFWNAYSRLIWVYFFCVFHLFWNISVSSLLSDGVVPDWQVCDYCIYFCMLYLHCDEYCAIWQCFVACNGFHSSKYRFGFTVSLFIYRYSKVYWTALYTYSLSVN